MDLTYWLNKIMDNESISGIWSSNLIKCSRPTIDEMSVEVYNRDFEKLKGLINRLYTQMFDEIE